jgi:hypothetical protein
MADGAYHEIKLSLARIEEKLSKHGEKLSAIDQHLGALNGTVNHNCTDINELYRLSNIHENFNERLIGAFNAYKYIGMGLGILASAISIYAFLSI